MKFDFTISTGDLIIAAGFCLSLATSAWAVIRKFNQILDVFREYPPHRHTPLGEILYPAGMKPGKIESLAARKS
jgi:hypothetical protein